MVTAERLPCRGERAGGLAGGTSAGGRAGDRAAAWPPAYLALAAGSGNLQDAPAPSPKVRENIEPSVRLLPQLLLLQHHRRVPAIEIRL